MRASQVSTLVNNAAVDEPELITPERERNGLEKIGLDPERRAHAPVTTASGSASQRSASGICTVSCSAEERKNERRREG
jgi:hypothetical protein